MITSKPVRVGLDAMLTPDNCALMLIDHQPFQVSGVKNIDAALMINNVVMLAKAAKAFNVPTLLTTVLKDRGGNLIKPLQDVFPDQTPIDRTTINTLPLVTHTSAPSGMSAEPTLQGSLASFSKPTRAWSALGRSVM
jgi:nicotinamidase-related amidase